MAPSSESDPPQPAKSGFRHSDTAAVRLENQRVYLRPLTSTDIPDVREIMYYDGRAASSSEEALAMLARIHDDVARDESLHWGVFLQETDVCVGTCGFYRGFAGGAGEIGYVLRERYRGAGIMTTAVTLVIEYGFGALGLQRIVADVAPDNAASIRLLERLGFRLEGDNEGYRRYGLPSAPAS